MSKLTPTSYALLGLLARKPWSAYELNQHMQASVLSAFWPRAASHVYSEPKKLVTLKLVTARQEERNGRQRTIYKITSAGRRELQAWLSSPTESYVTLSFEAMLKFLYAESADKASLDDNLDDIEASAMNAIAVVLEGTRPIADEQPGNSQGMPYNGLALKFLADVLEAQLCWVRNTRESLKHLEETGPSEQSLQLGVKSYKQLVNRLETLLKEGA